MIAITDKILRDEIVEKNSGNEEGNRTNQTEYV